MSTPSASGQPTLGRFLLVREIARSNDIVWEGRDPQVNRRVAVKELALPANLTGQPRRDRIERFYREGRAAGGLNHPNIVTIYEVGEDRGQFYIAMEFLEGHTLRERLNVGGPIPLTEVGKIANDLCSALQYAHERGIVHRDVKPDNIHLLPGNLVKLTDFGIARIAGENQLTVAGQVFGTPSYMSPEQVLGHPIDARSDQFALAIVIYEMIGGLKPFSGDSIPTITYRIIHEQAPHVLGAPPAVDAVLQRAMSKDPAGRYNSVGEFSAALQAAIAMGTGASRSYQPTHQTQYPSAHQPSAGPAYPSQPPQQATAMYGAQTQFGVAPGAMPPGPAMPPPTAQYTQHGYPPGVAPAQTAAAPYPMDRGGAPGINSNQRTIAAVLISIVVIVTVLIGGSIVLSKAFHNFSGANTVAQNNETFGKATQLYEFGDYESAAAAFNQVRMTPGVSEDLRQKSMQNEVFCYRQLAHKAQEQNDLATAQRWYQSALTVNPGDSQAQEEMAAIQRQQGVNNPAGNSVPFGGSGTSATATNGGSNGPRLDGAIPLDHPAVAPSNITTNDFEAIRAANEARSAPFLQQAKDADSRGDFTNAQLLYHKAMEAGPGSNSALEANTLLEKSLAIHPDNSGL